MEDVLQQALTKEEMRALVLFPTKERDIYDVAMGIKRDEVDYKENITDPKLRASVVSSVINNMNNSENKKLLSLLDGEFAIDGILDASTGQSNLFVTNVIRGATVLQNKYDFFADPLGTFGLCPACYFGPLGGPGTAWGRQITCCFVFCCNIF